MRERERERERERARERERDRERVGGGEGLQGLTKIDHVLHCYNYVCLEDIVLFPPSLKPSKCSSRVVYSLMKEEDLLKCPACLQLFMYK